MRFSARGIMFPKSCNSFSVLMCRMCRRLLWVAGLGWLWGMQFPVIKKLWTSSYVLVAGGSKVTDKLKALENLLNYVDRVVIGGAMANTFLAAQGVKIGKSLYEADMVPIAANLLAQSKARGVEIPVPTDVVVATEFAASAEAESGKPTESPALSRVMPAKGLNAEPVVRRQLEQ